MGDDALGLADALLGLLYDMIRRVVGEADDDGFLWGDSHGGSGEESGQNRESSEAHLPARVDGRLRNGCGWGFCWKALCILLWALAESRVLLGRWMPGPCSQILDIRGRSTISCLGKRTSLLQPEVALHAGRPITAVFDRSHSVLAFHPCVPRFAISLQCVRRPFEPHS